jgi:hypothetical protein
VETVLVVILLYHDRGPLAHAIQRRTGSPYDHVALRFSDGRTYQSLPFRGVVSGRAGQPAAAVHLFVCPAQAARMRNWVEQQVGLRYDWRGLASHVRGRFHPTGSRWQCCSFVASALRAGGVRTPDPWRMHPADFRRIVMGTK